MNLHKKMPLRQKLRIKYQYHWMDVPSPFYKDIALPTWFMTHNATQIERHIDNYMALMEKREREDEELRREVREFQKKLHERRERRHLKRL